MTIHPRYRLIGVGGTHLLAAYVMCILQATHIFDGLERWPTHIMFLSGGRLKIWSKAEDIPELANDQLLQLAEK